LVKEEILSEVKAKNFVKCLPRFFSTREFTSTKSIIFMLTKLLPKELLVYDISCNHSFPTVNVSNNIKSQYGSYFEI